MNKIYQTEAYSFMSSSGCLHVARTTEATGRFLLTSPLHPSQSLVCLPAPDISEKSMLKFQTG